MNENHNNNRIVVKLTENDSTMEQAADSNGTDRQPVPLPQGRLVEEPKQFLDSNRHIM